MSNKQIGTFQLHPQFIQYTSYSTMFRLIYVAILWYKPCNNLAWSLLYIIPAVVSDQQLNHSTYKNKEISLKKHRNVWLL